MRLTWAKAIRRAHKGDLSDLMRRAKRVHEKLADAHESYRDDFSPVERFYAELDSSLWRQRLDRAWSYHVLSTLK